MKMEKGYRSSKTGQAYLSLRPGDRILVYDTETTGTDPEKDRIVEISWIELLFDRDSFEVVDEADFYIKPPFPMPEEASSVNGITDEMLKDQPSEEEVIDKIFSKFGNKPDFVCGHNLIFDNRMMRHMYRRNGKGEFSPITVIDTLPAARDLISVATVEGWFIEQGLGPQRNQKGYYKLENLAKMLKVDKGLTFHRSIDDVKATIGLFKIFYEEYLETAPEITQPRTANEMLEKIQREQETMFPEIKGERPKIYSIWAKRFSETGDYLFITASTGKYQFNKYYRTWKVREEWKKADMEALIEEVVKYTGVKSPDDLPFWKAPKKT